MIRAGLAYRPPYFCSICQEARCKVKEKVCPACRERWDLEEPWVQAAIEMNDAAYYRNIAHKSRERPIDLVEH